MTVNYEPFGVYVVVEVDDRIVVVNDNKSIHLPFDYGIRGDTPQKFAKRIIGSITSEAHFFIKSLPFVKRKAIDTIPEKIKKGWPEGCFTIPIYAFSCTLSTQLDSLSSNYLLKKKESLKNGFTGLESQVINTLSEYNK